MKVVEVLVEEYYTRVVALEGYKMVVKVVGNCMKAWEEVDCMKVWVMEDCMKVGVRCMMAEGGHMMAGYLGDYKKVWGQEDYKWKVEGLERVGCSWVEVQVFHTYLAHCTTVLVDCMKPQVQVRCMRNLKIRHSICPH